MQFVVYIAVLLVAVFSVVLEFDALVEPIASNRHVVHTAQSSPQPVPRAADKAREVRAAAPAQTGQQPAAAAPSTVGAAPRAEEGPSPAVAPTTVGAAPEASPPATDTAGTDRVAAAPAADAAATGPRCDVEACAAAYASFRAADCSYQPFAGLRRTCTRGAVARTADSAAEARAQARPVSYAACNRRACAEAYSSFNPSDCTFQPFEGPRQLCKK